jgi:hypothetical protein
LEYVLAGTDWPGERLPQTNRFIRLRVTARDTHHHGSSSFADTRILATNISGPFRIISHAEPQDVHGTIRIEWSTGGTERLPVPVTHVRILLSTNGGFSFPLLLAESTPNDGTESVVLPAIDAENARLKIEPIGNIFFDINDAPLRLSSLSGIRLRVDRAPGEFRISWASEAGTTYTLQRAEKMGISGWEEVLRTNATSSATSVSLSSQDAASYFRLIRE